MNAVAEREAALASHLQDEANRARVGRGLAALVGDRVLCAAALQHAQRMRNLEFFAHADPHDHTTMAQRLEAVGARGLRWVGENLALCPDDPAVAIELWLASAGHRANLLYRDAVRVGQAAAVGREAIYWVQLYARCSEDPSPRGPARTMRRMSVAE